jgi:hypothetical protein
VKTFDRFGDALVCRDQRLADDQPWLPSEQEHQPLRQNYQVVNLDTGDIAEWTSLLPPGPRTHEHLRAARCYLDTAGHMPQQPPDRAQSGLVYAGEVPVAASTERPAAHAGGALVARAEPDARTPRGPAGAGRAGPV